MWPLWLTVEPIAVCYKHLSPLKVSVMVAVWVPLGALQICNKWPQKNNVIVVKMQIVGSGNQLIMSQWQSFFYSGKCSLQMYLWNIPSKHHWKCSVVVCEWISFGKQGWMCKNDSTEMHGGNWPLACPQLTHCGGQHAIMLIFYNSVAVESSIQFCKH